MHTRQKRKRFIQLRGQGLSYRKIAERINVSTPTLIRWSRIFAVQINNSQMIEFDGLQEEYLVTRQHRVKVLATQLNNVTKQLIECDLSKIPPHRLLEMQTQLSKELQSQCPKMEFDRKLIRGGPEDVKRVMDKTVSWQA